MVMCIIFGKSFKQLIELHNMQVLKPLGLGILSVIMLIGIIAMITELIEIEEVAKTIVIPSLILLIAVTGYAMFQTYTYNRLR